jgi:hypothetical protein
LSVVFCLDLDPFFFLVLFPLMGVCSFVHLFTHFWKVSLLRSSIWSMIIIRCQEKRVKERGWKSTTYFVLTVFKNIPFLPSFLKDKVAGPDDTQHQWVCLALKLSVSFFQRVKNEALFLASS